ncbi:ABC transporter permease [Streptomyces sp. NPDC059506]|uniref:ABC transporter permease n=1 Tax=Streptomyces TaxID=1883 RepID=UPI000CC9A6E7|nr:MULTISPECIES: ABC transporter permease [unclassified Streptomyces]MCZ2523718.1 ABC transporter permease [Streptomyces sp. HB2AG]PLW74031.1 ABC transporter [Streptomyces sp. DJ]QMV21038.1 ABC transporter permease [Streptomyces sp. SCUT-3]
MSDTTHGDAATAAASPVTSPDDGLSPAALAEKYGLSVSGARPGLAEYVRQLWGRRHFIRAYASARVTAQYTNARLGQLWQVMTPLLNAAVYFLIFGVLLGSKRGIENYVAYLIIGIFIFTFTQSSVLAGVKAISGNLGLIRALHFPRASLPVAFTLMQLQQLLISMAVMLVIVLFTGEVPAWSWLLIVPALLLQSVFNVGLALGMARLGSKMTDLTQLMPFILRTWLYASGVFYSIRAVLEKHDLPWIVHLLLELNPAAVYIDLVRFALIDSFGRNELPPHVWAVAVGWALVAGIGGFLFFWKAEESYGRG